VEYEPQHRPGRYIAIQVAGKYYAIRSESVREMMPSQDLFPWANGSQGLLGLLHLRGSRIPVFDLAARLGAPARTIRITPQTRLIVAEVHGERTAFYADRLTDMIQARAHEIRNGSIQGHGRPKQIIKLDTLWKREELTELAS
jgi:purine-binding chemotaxis protein CheW